MTSCRPCTLLSRGEMADIGEACRLLLLMVMVMVMVMVTTTTTTTMMMMMMMRMVVVVVVVVMKMMRMLMRMLMLASRMSRWSYQPSLRAQVSLTVEVKVEGERCGR